MVINVIPTLFFGVFFYFKGWESKGMGVSVRAYKIAVRKKNQGL